MVSSTRPFQVIPSHHAMVIFDYVDGADRAHRHAIRRTLFDIGGEAERDMVTELTTGPRSGRVYKVRGRLIRSSAPGEFPARRTGVLARAADHVVRSHIELEVGVRRRRGKRVGRFLEFGTRKMERRPFIEPTANKFAGTAATLLLRFGRVALRRR